MREGEPEARLHERVPPLLKAAARPVVHWLGDTWNRSRGQPIPPWSLRSQVPGDWRAVGKEFLGYIVDLGGLQPDDRVLDIGCRAGRMAVPLTGFLSADARYEGVDSWEEGTAWCQRTVTPRNPNFHFSQIETERDRSRGATASQRGIARLPYDDGTFDFVILISIVHLSPDVFQSYLSEVARLVRKGGTYFGTWFLCGENGPESSRPAPPITCTESEARRQLGSLGLTVEAVYRGSWNGWESALSYQDLVIGRKTG